MPARRVLLGLGLLVAASACARPDAQADRRPDPTHAPRLNVPNSSVPTSIERPATRKDDIVDELHGVPVADPYRWLEDVDNANVKGWMDAQNAHARSVLDAYPDRDALRQRLRSLLYVDSISPPSKRGDRLFYFRRHADKEKAIYYTRPRAGEQERVLLDPNTMSDDGSVSLHGAFPTWDGTRVAYKLSRNAADAATLHVRDAATGEDLPDVLEGARYAAPQWRPDGSGFYYTALPTDPTIPVSELPGYAEIRFHRMGTPQSEDTLVYPALRDPTTFLGVQHSRDGHYLLVTISRGFDSTDVYFADLRRGGDFQPLTVGTKWRTSVDVHDGTFYVYTNDGAPRFRVFAVDPGHPQRDAWTEIVAESDATLEEASVVGGKLSLSYLDNAASRLELRDLDGSNPRAIELPGLGMSTGLIGMPDDDEAYYYYNSFTETTRIFRTSVSTGETELWHAVEIPVDTSAFEVEQVWYPSKDGTEIPMFVVHRRDVKLDGSNPTMLTGYGGFSVSMTPAFSSGAVLWLERGGVWAVPNLRGGGEFGEEWHEAGKGSRKQNVFDDFIGAAQYLIEAGYTRPDKLAIRGGSNGGLLVGAAMTQRPELFGAVVCEVPLLDMVRYHLFGSGKTWTSEYGSAEDPREFATLYAYSPYHKVSPGARYPALLMNSADSDDRVDPMHARKFVAAVQAVTPPSAPILLRIEKNAGHGGADLIKQSVESGVDVYSFLLATLGQTRAHG